MKVVSSIGNLKNRSKDCQVVKRRGRIYVICKSDPRFKVRQGYKKKRNKRIIYNFRANDIANGGEGAPLAPIFHQLIVSKKKAMFKMSFCQNL